MVISFRRRCNRAMCTIVCTLAMSSLRAQSHTYSLQELIDAARRNQPALQAKHSKVEAADASIRDTRHAALPMLKLHDQVSLASANGATGTFFPLGVIVPTAGAIRPENNFQPASGNIAMVYTEYELANFGLNKARVEDAKAERALDLADFERARYDNGLQIARGYFRLLKTYHELDIERQNVNRYDTLFNIIRAQSASGLKAGADSVQTQAELSKARQAFNIKAGEMEQLKIDISLLTGIASDAIAIDTGLTRYNGLVSTNNHSDTAYTTINPFINYYYQQVERSRSREHLAKKSFLPKLLFVGGAWARGSSIDYTDNYNALSQGLGYQRFNYAVGLAFSYNVFDLVHRHDKTMVNHFETAQTDYELQQAELQLQILSRKAAAALDVIEQNRNELPVQSRSTEALYRQKLAQYQAGVSNLIDLTNAAYLLYKVQSDEVQLLTDWFQANLDRAAANGTLYQFIQSIK